MGRLCLLFLFSLCMIFNLCSGLQAITRVARSPAHLPFVKLNLSPAIIRCEQYLAKHEKGHTRWGGPILGPLVRFHNMWIVGIFFTIILRVLNRFRIYRQVNLLKYIFNRPKGRGLLTVSNHQSVLDDPGLWAAVLPWWRMRPEQLKWTLCTEDVFFYKPWLTSIIAAGNTMPLDRKGLLDQPLFRLFHQKLVTGAWCHIFPEGRIWQNWRFNESTEAILGPFKHGVGKLIAHSHPNIPVVIPMYHKGMSNIIPEKQLPHAKKGQPSVPQSLKPGTKQLIEYYVGEPIDFTEKVEKFHKEYPGLLSQWRSSWPTLQFYKEITEEIRVKVLELEAEAYGRKEPIYDAEQSKDRIEVADLEDNKTAR